MPTLHERTRDHPYTDTCFGCKVGTLTFNGSSEAMATTARERVLRKDLDAYARLRGEGMQPAHVRGSYDAEQRSDTKLEVEHPKLRNLPEQAKPYVADMVQAATEIPASISRFQDA